MFGCRTKDAKYNEVCEPFLECIVISRRNTAVKDVSRRRASLSAIALGAGLVASGAVSGNAVAQLAGKGGLNGRVVDTTGATIPGADIQVIQQGTNIKQEAHTTSSGDYSFSLDAGKYTLVISHEGFKSVTQQNVTVDALQTFSVDVTLPLGESTEQVTVTDAPPTLETSNATLGATMEQEQYSALPLIQDGGGQRRATDFAALLPGVGGNVTNGNGTTNAGICERWRQPWRRFVDLHRWGANHFGGGRRRPALCVDLDGRGRD